MKHVNTMVGATIHALASLGAGVLITCHFMSTFIDEIMRPCPHVDRFALAVTDDYAIASMLYQGEHAKTPEIVNLRLDGNAIALDAVVSESEHEGPSIMPPRLCIKSKCQDMHTPKFMMMGTFRSSYMTIQNI